MLWRLIPFLSILLLTSSCNLSGESPLESSNDEVNLIQVGDIIVTNNGNDSIILLNDDGSFKATLVDAQTDASILFNALIYDSLNKKILFSYDHTTATLDAVRSISLYDGEVATEIANSNVQGTLPGLARLTAGDLIILKNTTNAEKFLANGQRISTAPYPLTILFATTTDVAPLLTGGFMVCNNATTNTVKTYNAAGVVQAASATSAVPTPALATAGGTSSCIQGSNGTIYVVYSGTVDAVRAYNSTLTTTLWTYIDTNTLVSPGKIAIRPNGNLLIADQNFDHLVELNSNGGFVGTIGGVGLSDPLNIAVVK